MKIFDCFLFFNELELLELRFMELYDTVDYFVLVEANQTHTGKPKEFIFEANKERYKEFLDKVIYVKLENCPTYSLDDTPIIEHFQRNSIMRGLEGKAVQGDKIHVSDLDEIPRAESIKAHKDVVTWFFFQHDLFYYYVNCQVNQSCGGTAMAPFGTFRSPQQLRRFASRRYACTVDDESMATHAGWHYSYLTGGDPEKIRFKVENIFESNGILDLIGSREDIITKVANHTDLYNRARWRHQQKIVDISQTQPKSMDKFLEKYPHFFYKENKI